MVHRIWGRPMFINDQILSLLAPIQAWNIERLDFVSFIFQVSAHSFEDHAVLDVNNSSHVLANHDPRFECLDNAKHLWPEMSVVTRSFLFARDRERLTRESSCDDIGKFNSVCNEFFFCDFSDIFIYLFTFPMFINYQFTILIIIAESYSFKIPVLSNPKLNPPSPLKRSNTLSFSVI